MTSLRNGSEVAQLLDQGELDVGLGGHLQTLASALNGSDQSFFAAVGFEEAPEHLPVAMVVGSAGPAKGLADGATIAMSARAAISDLQLRIYAEAETIDYSSLTIVTMPFAEMQSSLTSGEIDAASIPDPFASQIENSAAARIVDRGTLSKQMPAGGRVMITGLVSTKRWIADHAELANSVAEVIRRVIDAGLDRVDAGAISSAAHVHEPTFDTTLRAGDLQLAFDLAAHYGVVAGELAAASVIADLRPGPSRYR